MLAPRLTDFAVEQSVNDSDDGLIVAVVPFGTVILTVTATGVLDDALHFGLFPGSPGSLVAASV